MVKILWLGGVPSARRLRNQWLRRHVLYGLQGVESTIYRAGSGNFAHSDAEATSLHIRFENIRHHKVGRFYRFSPVIAWHLLVRRYDFVFTFMLGSFPTICSLILAHIVRRKRYLIMAENWYPRSNRWVNWWYRQVAIHATLVIAQSTKAYDFMRKSLRVPEDRLIKCVNTLEDPTNLPYNKKLVEELNSDASLKLVCVARFEQFKGQDVLIEAFKGLDPMGVKLILVGNCDTRFGEACRQLAGGDSRIIFVGRAQFEDVLSYYRASDVFVLANKFCDDRIEGAESFGYAPLEAAHFGLPLILTTATGCADDLIVEGKTGYQVPANDINAFRDQLHRVVDSPAIIAEMSANVRTHVRQLCSENSTASLKFAMERLLEGSNGGRSWGGRRS